jgi:hypothetical protein
LAEHASGGRVCGYQQIIGNTKRTEYFADLEWEDFLAGQEGETKHYLALGTWERDFRRLFEDRPEFVDRTEAVLKMDPKSVLFYSNGEMDLYYRRP